MGRFSDIVKKDLIISERMGILPGAIPTLISQCVRCRPKFLNGTDHLFVQISQVQNG